MKLVKAFFVAVSALAFVSCNTVSGVGQDIEAGGEAIQHSAHSH